MFVDSTRITGYELPLKAELRTRSSEDQDNEAEIIGTMILLLAQSLFSARVFRKSPASSGLDPKIQKIGLGDLGRSESRRSRRNSKLRDRNTSRIRPSLIAESARLAGDL